jgi:hypothetical protein
VDSQQQPSAWLPHNQANTKQRVVAHVEPTPVVPTGPNPPASGGGLPAGGSGLQTGAISSQNAPTLGTQGAQGSGLVQGAQNTQVNQNAPPPGAGIGFQSGQTVVNPGFVFGQVQTSQIGTQIIPPQNGYQQQTQYQTQQGQTMGAGPSNYQQQSWQLPSSFPPQTGNIGVNSGNQPQSGYGQQYQQPNPAVMNTNMPQNGMSQQPGAMGAPGSGQHQHGVYTPPQTNPTGAHAPGMGNQTVNNQQTAGNGQGPRTPPPGGYNAMPPGNRLYQHAAPYDPNTVFPHNAQQPIVMQPNIPSKTSLSKTSLSKTFPSIITLNPTILRVMLGFPQTLTFLQGLTPKPSRLVEQKLTLEPLAS